MRALGAVRKIFCLKRDEEVCGVIVYCYPPPSAYDRRMVLPRMRMSELNEKLSIIRRAVMLPKYRTTGLGSELIRETLPLAGADYVEMSAVMAKCNPFAERARLVLMEYRARPKVLRLFPESSGIGSTLE